MNVIDRVIIEFPRYLRFKEKIPLVTQVRAKSRIPAFFGREIKQSSGA